MWLLIKWVSSRIKMTKEAKLLLLKEVQSINFGHALKYAKDY